MNDYDLIVDSREKENVRKVLDSYGVKYRLEALPCGDYQIRTDNSRITIERKTVSDFIGSLMSGRLEDQMRRLADEPVPMLLITGSFSEYKRYAKGSRFTQDQMIGAIASCIVRYGLRTVIWIQGNESNPHATGIAMISKLLMKLKEGKLDKIPDRKIKTSNGHPQRELIHLICGVPSNVAQALLDRFGCPRAIMEAKDKALLEVKGMGKTRIIKMRTLLGDLK